MWVRCVPEIVLVEISPKETEIYGTDYTSLKL